MIDRERLAEMLRAALLYEGGDARMDRETPYLDSFTIDGEVDLLAVADNLLTDFPRQGYTILADIEAQGYVLVPRHLTHEEMEPIVDNVLVGCCTPTPAEVRDFWEVAINAVTQTGEKG